MIGQTKDAGFQIGVRRTFALSVGEAWNFLTSAQGQHIWLGASDPVQIAVGASYTTTDGAQGVIRVVNPAVNLRLSWRPAGWAKASTIQVRVIPSGDKAVISFHQENLPGAREREQMRRRWQQVLDRLEEALPQR